MCNPLYISDIVVLEVQHCITITVILVCKQLKNKIIYLNCDAYDILPGFHAGVIFNFMVPPLNIKDLLILK